MGRKEGYGRLQTESVRQRLEARERLRSARMKAEATGGSLPVAEEGLEFDRAMKLLDRWDRRDGRLGGREVGHGRPRRVTFEEAMVALERKLDNLGVRRARSG